MRSQTVLLHDEGTLNTTDGLFWQQIIFTAPGTILFRHHHCRFSELSGQLLGCLLVQFPADAHTVPDAFISLMRLCDGYVVAFPGQFDFKGLF